MSQWVEDSMNQIVNDSWMVQWTGESTNQWIIASTVEESMKHWIKDSMNQCFSDQCVNESMNQWINESMNQWFNDKWANESMNQWIHKSMNQWFNNLNQGTNESNQRNMLPTSSSKSAPILSGFLILRCKSNSRYSLVHIMPSSFSKSAPSMPIFSTFANRALADVLHTLCRQLSQIEPRTHGNRDPTSTSATPGATLPEKTQGFGARECSHPWIHTLPNCHASQLLDDGWLTWWSGWRNNGVDLMMWLTWCWECEPWHRP